MSSVVTSSTRTGSPPRARGAATPGRLDVEQLRHPKERAALAFSVVANLVVLALGVIVVLEGSQWLADHEVLARHADWLRGVLLAALAASALLPLTRYVRIDIARNNGVRIGEEQFPELHARLLEACGTLGIDPVPELYLSGEIDDSAVAYSYGTGPGIVVINADLVTTEWRDGLDWLAFVMAGALGTLRLGHTSFWVELLTTYSIRIPGVRTPLLVTWTYSRDRCAATVLPDGIRGLILEAVGMDAVPSVKLAPLIAQTRRAGGIGDALGALLRKKPLLTARLEALYSAGLFDRARDLASDHPTLPGV